MSKPPSPPSLDFTRQVLRTQVCSQCFTHPPGSESWCCEKPRDCEPRCRLFQHARLLRRSAGHLDTMLAAHQHILERLLQHIPRDPAAVATRAHCSVEIAK
jgi:hypothetical protein